jgi:deoxycytidine triphosphate deaminase
MLVISDNLRGIVKEFKLCPLDLVEEFSIKINLDPTIRRMRAPPAVAAPVRFGIPFDPDFYFEKEQKLTSDLIIEPQQNVLACSVSPYAMPKGYFGLIQTKGSLARLFTSVTSNDGQVEPGYCGKLTLEMTNHANFPIAIPAGANIAQLFIFRCSTDAINPYNGKYQNADRPTVYSFD